MSIDSMKRAVQVHLTKTAAAAALGGYDLIQVSLDYLKRRYSGEEE